MCEHTGFTGTYCYEVLWINLNLKDFPLIYGIPPNTQNRLL